MCSLVLKDRSSKRRDWWCDRISLPSWLWWTDSIGTLLQGPIFISLPLFLSVSSLPQALMCL